MAVNVLFDPPFYRRLSVQRVGRTGAGMPGRIGALARRIVNVLDQPLVQAIRIVMNKVGFDTPGMPASQRHVLVHPAIFTTRHTVPPHAQQPYRIHPTVFDPAALEKCPATKDDSTYFRGKTVKSRHQKLPYLGSQAFIGVEPEYPTRL